MPSVLSLLFPFTLHLSEIMHMMNINYLEHPGPQYRHVWLLLCLI